MRYNPLKPVLSPGTRDTGVGIKMKSQDFLVLVKLISMKKRYESNFFYSSTRYKMPYDEAIHLPDYESELFHDLSVRNLGNSLGISKTEISSSLRRSIESNLLAFKEIKIERMINLNDFDWMINAKALFNLIQHGFPYFYPIKQIGMTYGLETGFAAPILSGELTSAGDKPYVWATEHGNALGLGIEPIYKSVPFAASNDEYVYNCFALIDAFRIGRPREKHIALNILEEILLGK